MSRMFYQLAGLIVATREIGEADWLLVVITPDYGLIKVVAKGVRLSKSKLRPSLPLWRPVSLTVVKGREIWRLVGAERVGHSTLALPAERLFAKLSVLLLRLVPEEAPAPALYRELKAGLEYFAKFNAFNLTPAVASAGELILVWRTLSALGYASPPAGLPPLLIQGRWDRELLVQTHRARRQTAAAINHSLSASQL